MNGIKCNFNASPGREGAQQQYDEADLALSIFSDFAVRKDAVLIAGVYLGQLLPALRSERATTRKHVLDIVGSCLSHYHVLVPQDQQALVALLSFFVRDRDATCRLKALTGIMTSWKEGKSADAEISHNFVPIVLKRIVDKSKAVRLKALQSLGSLLSGASVSHSRILLDDLESELVTKISKLLLISSDSPHFCKETTEAAGNVLCSSCLSGPHMTETLDMLLSFELGSARLPVVLKVLCFHLNGYEEWLQFLTQISEDSMDNVQRFLTASVVDHGAICTDMRNMLKNACLELQGQGLDQLRLLGSLRLIFIFTLVYHIKVPKLEHVSRVLAGILIEQITTLCKMEEGERQLKRSLIKWLLKTFAATFKDSKEGLTAEVFQLLEAKLIDVYSEGIEGCSDCIFSVKNPYALSKKILRGYEDTLQVLDSPQPLKVLQGYLVFIGDLSRSYQFACDAFIKCLREAQKQISVPASCDDAVSDFDYLQQEEHRAQEEDAVSRFARMLLDGDSVPGCYVPFLHELACTATLPADLRASAIGSLGRYMISSSDLAEKYRGTIESLLNSEEPEIQHTALYLAEALVLAFPNDYLPVLGIILSLLQVEKVKNAAFTVYANLILGKKFKLDVLLGPICDGLCDENEKISSIAIFLLKRLVQEAGKYKHKLLISLWNHCPNVESHKKLARVLVENVLDDTDLQSDELASSALQILALGQHGVAFLASFLHPSFKVLQTLDSYLSSSPPKVDLKGDAEASEYLCQFVRNCRRVKTASASEKELVARLLEKLQRKGSRKRRSQVSSIKSSRLYNSLADYEKAIESFKQCEITSSLWELFRHDI